MRAIAGKQTVIDLAIAVVALAMIGAVALARHAPPPHAPAQEATRFATLDVYVNATGKAVAAYQAEIIPQPAGADPGKSQVTLVGISGGESHPAYAEPPYYDPAALHGAQARVILAGLTTARNLPVGRTRVARLHVAYAGATPQFTTRGSVLASVDAQPIAGGTIVLDLVETRGDAR